MLLFALALVAFAPTPAPPDTTDAPPAGDASGVEVRTRFAPSALYSRDYGLGIGVGVGVRNLGAAGTDLTADVRLHRHFQGAEVAFRTSALDARRVSADVSIGGSTTDRRFYAGVGPAPISASDVDLSHDAAWAEAGVRVYPVGTTVLSVRPSAEVRTDRSDGVARDWGTVDGLDGASRRAVEAAVGRRTGVWLGAELATDLRDRPGRPRRGVLAQAEHRRFVTLAGADLGLAQTAGSVVGYVPLGEVVTGLVHGTAAVTRRTDDGPGAIPFVYLPTLDGGLGAPFRPNRLTGRDVLAVGAGVRATLVDLYGLYGLDVTAVGYLGNAYDSVADQFRPAVSFGPGGVLDGDGRAALRPGLALGLALADLDDGRAVAGVGLGLGPGGPALVSVRVAYDLRRLRPRLY